MRHLTLLFVCLALWVPSFASAQELLYAGTLAKGGEPVNETVRMTFRIFADLDEGQALWTSDEIDVKVEGGRFEHTLGSGKKIDDDVFYEEPGPRWVEVTIGQIALSPRTRLASVPPAASDVSFQPEGGDATNVQAELVALRAEVEALQSQLGDLAKLSSYVTIEEDAQGDNASIFFDRVNLYVRNGLGNTNQNNSYGNLFVGYQEVCEGSEIYDTPGQNEDEDRICDPIRALSGTYRTGSHNIVVGRYHNWETHGGLLVGEGNEMYSPFGAAIGGRENKVTGLRAVVISGESGVARGLHSVVIGGEDNSCEGEESVVLGGQENSIQDSAEESVVLGGEKNTMKQDSSIILGGAINTSNGDRSVMVGGKNNEIDYSGGGDRDYGVLWGGEDNTLSGEYAVSLGGNGNNNNGSFALALGGSNNLVTARHGASVSGRGNKTHDRFSVTLGGAGNTLGTDGFPEDQFSVQIGGATNQGDAVYSVGVGGVSRTIAAASANQCRVATMTYDDP